VKLPNLSVAAKLYLIFALLATVTVALASVTVLNARRHATLADEFRPAFVGAMNVELVNALIYAVVMESRGIYMSSDVPTAKVVDTAAERTTETAAEVMRVGEATAATRESAMAVKTVADDLGAVAARIRGQVDQFFTKLHAA
jgi:hypothetical protein